ncbi:cupin domain-containing protein [Teichococcus vastitatis]|uniref:cupin domain-containing protein n=1 Tax=Teichococcus vastitatis TaxID=2307076 RepID=UPI000E717C97
MSIGLAEIAPGGILPLHHHEPAEIYHVVDGEGVVEVEGVAHHLHPGISMFIPADAWHRRPTLAPSRSASCSCSRPKASRRSSTTSIDHGRKRFS